MDLENVAYDLSMYETQVRENTDSQKKTQQTKVIKIKNKRTFKTVVNVMSIAVIVSLIIGVLYTNSEITQTANSISQVKKSITEIDSEKAYLEFTLESKMSLNEVEDYAVGVLGMVKMDSSQLEYVEIENENKIEKGNDNLTEKIQEAVQPVLSYFKP